MVKTVQTVANKTVAQNDRIYLQCKMLYTHGDAWKIVFDETIKKHRALKKKKY